MQKNNAIILLAGCALLAIASAASAADINGPGLAFKASNGSQQSCLARSSYGAIVNTCSSRVEVHLWVPIVNTGSHATSVRVYGNNTWCQSVSTNNVGNGSHVGGKVWTSAGSNSWNTINTGTRTVWGWSPMLFRCGLDAGEKIASVSAKW